MDDEQREQRLIQEQIERARLEAELTGQLTEEPSTEASELIRQSEDEKIKLNMSLKAVAVPTGAVSAASAASTTATGTVAKPKPLAALAMAKVVHGTPGLVG